MSLVCYLLASASLGVQYSHCLLFLSAPAQALVATDGDGPYVLRLLLRVNRAHVLLNHAVMILLVLLLLERLF